LDGKKSKDWATEVSAAEYLRNKIRVQRLGKVILAFLDEDKIPKKIR